MCRGAIASLAGFLLLASVAGGVPVLQGAVGTYSYPNPGTYGRAVGFYPNGDVLLVSAVSGCGGYDFAVSRLDPTFTAARWTRTHDVMCMDNEPRTVVMDGESAYIAGGTSSGCFLVRIDGSGNLSWTGYPGSIDGIYGVARDPVDGSCWVVGAGGAPAWTYLYHYSVGGSLISVDMYQYTAIEARGYCVAVTEDSVYIGGSTRDPSWTMDWPWIMRRDRASGAIVYSNRIQPANPVSSNSFRSLAVSSGRLFALYVQDNSGMSRYSAYPAEILANGNAFQVGHAVATDAWYIAPPPPPVYGQLIAHPSLPLLVAGSRTNAICLDLTLNLAGQVPVLNDSGSGTFIGGVAVSDSLNYTLAVAYKENVSAMDYARVSGYRFGVDVAKAFADNDLLVAPNVLDLSRPGAGMRFIVKGNGSSTAPVSLRVFDTGGNLVTTLELEFGAGGNAEYRWDGRMEDGSRIGPGSYIAVATGDGVEGTARRPFLVTPGKGKK